MLCGEIWRWIKIPLTYKQERTINVNGWEMNLQHLLCGASKLLPGQAQMVMKQ